MRVLFYSVLLLTIAALELASATPDSRNQRRRCSIESELRSQRDTLETMSAVMMSNLPEDCSAAMRRGSRSIYQMIAPLGMCPRMVRCDMTTQGGGWTVVLWRTPHPPPRQPRDINNLLSSFCDDAMGATDESEMIDDNDVSEDTVYHVDKNDAARARANEISRTVGEDKRSGGRRRAGRGGVYRRRSSQVEEGVRSLREDFNRTWSEYKRGFGHYQSEYWIGNEMLHRLTVSTNEKWEALILLVDHSGQEANAAYHQFRVSDEYSKYELHASGYNNDSTNPAGDSLRFHHGRPFSTHDRDNDKYPDSHCGAEHGAGWWFYQCHTSLLTGAAGERSQGGHNYIHWNDWRAREALHSAAILIRPKHKE